MGEEVDESPPHSHRTAVLAGFELLQIIHIERGLWREGCDSTLTPSKGTHPPRAVCNIASHKAARI